ncbi:DUF1345 domain-containing protein [Micromonospora chersina]
MTELPPENLYHRSLGWHAPALRRAVIVAAIWLISSLVLLRFVPWELAVVLGWDTAALVFLTSTWRIIIGAGSGQTPLLAGREDPRRGIAAVLVIGAGAVTLPAAGVVFSLAGRHSGSARLLLVGVATLTLLLSWAAINTVFTLHYAHLHFRTTAGGIDLDDPLGRQPPTYRDFAYVAFTIGMTYQVSDTAVRDPRIRQSVLSHAILSYVFGVVIVASFVNLMGGLLGG